MALGDLEGTDNLDVVRPGTPGIWIFVFIDMIVFGLLFVVLVSERFRVPEVFATSQAGLDPLVGLLGTIFLIVSSWCVAEAVEGVRNGVLAKTRLCLSGAILLGLGFAANKIVEYHGKFEQGITPVSNDFYTFYFLITGLHFLHVVGGLCFLGHCRLRLGLEIGSVSYRKKLENTGLFWHFVDLLWLFIFPMFYLTGASWQG